ncbi:hypothetical protein MANES_16G049790v8 [Manihot esculenta]|uniref:Uncharacterized protein n=1 Tax=Manihot esculenta TaxID=3983 RepID=A0ACB7G789_MANES|nr:hypothetical protein MANES_16G049790v8 [Manihot esculenta]
MGNWSVTTANTLLLRLVRVLKGCYIFVQSTNLFVSDSSQLRVAKFRLQSSLICIMP